MVIAAFLGTAIARAKTSSTGRSKSSAIDGSKPDPGNAYITVLAHSGSFTAPDPGIAASIFRNSTPISISLHFGGSWQSFHCGNLIQRNQPIRISPYWSQRSACCSATRDRRSDCRRRFGQCVLRHRPVRQRTDRLLLFGRQAHAPASAIILRYSFAEGRGTNCLVTDRVSSVPWVLSLVIARDNGPGPAQPADRRLCKRVPGAIG